MELGSVFHSEQVGIVAGVKGDLILISAFSFLIDGVGYCSLDLFVIYENHWEAVFEAAFEIAVATVEDAIDAGFEKKRSAWMSVVLGGFEDADVVLFGEDDAGFGGVVADGFVEEVFVVMDRYFVGMRKLAQEVLSEWELFSFFFVVDDHWWRWGYFSSLLVFKKKGKWLAKRIEKMTNRVNDMMSVCLYW